MVLLAEARIRLPPLRKDDCILVQNQQENDKVPGRPSNADIVRPTMLSYGGVEGPLPLLVASAIQEGPLGKDFLLARYYPGYIQHVPIHSRELESVQSRQRSRERDRSSRHAHSTLGRSDLRLAS